MSPEVQLRQKIGRREIEPKWIGWAVVAKLIGVSVPTVRRWRRVGIGPIPWKLGKKTIRYTEQEVLAYLERLTAGDREIISGEPRWDPGTFQLLRDHEPAAEVAAEPVADEPEQVAEQDAHDEHVARLRALGVIGDRD